MTKKMYWLKWTIHLSTLFFCHELALTLQFNLQKKIYEHKTSKHELDERTVAGIIVNYLYSFFLLLTTDGLNAKYFLSLNELFEQLKFADNI